MFHYQDGVSEIIAHFVGQFHMSVEDMRLRHELEPGSARFQQSSETDQSHNTNSPFQHRIEIPNFIPGVQYVAPQAIIERVTIDASMNFDRIDLHIPFHQAHDAHLPKIFSPDTGAANSIALGPIPGSSVLIGYQQSSLYDNDFVKLGNGAVSVPLWQVHGNDGAVLDALYGKAAVAAAPFMAIDDVKNVSEIGTFVEATAKALNQYSVSADSLDGQNVKAVVFVEQGLSLEGNYSNGASVTTLPTLDFSVQAIIDDHAVNTDEAEVWGEAPEDALTIAEQEQSDGTMTISSGGNVQINETTLINAGLTSTVLTVMGDVHELDLIVQTNAQTSATLINGILPSGFVASDVLAVMQNSANFSHETIVQTAPDASELGVFPTNWQVSIVAGDIIFMDWIVQYNFASDNDMLVLTAAGSHTQVTTGENVALNGVSFADIGKFYDLIYVGGSLYDANMIFQTNILVDNDIIDVLPGFVTGSGAIGSGGNMQWNEAAIFNTGSSAWQTGMPAHVAEGAAILENGPGQMPTGFSSDDVFQGLANIKVLYITGNLYDLSYIEQTNILTDSDHLALYEQQLQQAQDLVWNDTVWAVSTGDNVQLNVATIYDYDSLGDHAYVGGTVYSEAILVQAEIVLTMPELFVPSGDQLVSEAIVFLSDDVGSSAGLPELAGLTDTIIAAPADAGSPDIIQSLLS